MNTKSIRFILGWILNIEALLMLLPVATAVVYREEEGVAYALVMAVCAAVGALMKAEQPELLRQGGLCLHRAGLDFDERVRLRTVHAHGGDPLLHRRDV